MIPPTVLRRAARRAFNSGWHVGLGRAAGLDPNVIADMEAGVVPVSSHVVAVLEDRLRDTIRQAEDRLYELAGSAQ